MVVDEAVVNSLREQPQNQVSTFVASCAERMVQIFTGLSGGDPARSGDLDVVVRLVDELWGSEVSSGVFQTRVAALERFQELEPSDEEIVDVAGIYAFYAALVLRYAALYRSSTNVENALRCAHASLTAMGQLDQNLPGSNFFPEEHDIQRHVSSMRMWDVEAVQALRANDRLVSQKRLEAILGRIKH